MWCCVKEWKYKSGKLNLKLQRNILDLLEFRAFAASIINRISENN